DLEKLFSLCCARLLRQHLDGLGGVAMAVVKVVGGDLVLSLMRAGLFTAFFQLVPVLVEGIESGLDGVDAAATKQEECGVANGRARGGTRRLAAEAIVALVAGIDE